MFYSEMMEDIYEATPLLQEEVDCYDCVVVEDEPLAIEMMVDYIAKRENLRLVAVVSELADLREILKTSKPSIIFLDLIVPLGVLDGFHYGKIPSDISIVVVSAIPLSHYGKTLPRSVKYELPKPVSFERFNQCVDKVTHRLKKI